MSSGTNFNFISLKAQLSALFKEAVLINNFNDFVSSSRSLISELNENDSKNAIELTVREVLLELIVQKPEIFILERVFQFSIEIAELDIGAGNLPVLVLGDMFESSTLIECETIFAFVENRVEIFKKDIFFRTCKNHLLRSCNDLLKRLSRSQNTVFCGRILLFLAHIFPLSERSGLNIISEFNLDNTTTYCSKEDSSNDVSSERDETVEEGEIINRHITADNNLYRKFWSLQDFFRNPNTCYNKIQWRNFTSCTSDILTVFGSFKSDDANSSKWKLAELPSPSGAAVYFAKYLTSPKLLELELSDSNFRRYLLVQFLILFQYLSSPVKFKLETFLLSDEQQAWIKESTKKIYTLLEETPPNGDAFCKNIINILKREEYWNAWKNEGCPDFKHVDEKADQKLNKLRKRSAEDASISNKKINVGSPELTKLWNINPNNWDACRSSKRNFLPQMETYFGIVPGKSEGVTLNKKKNLTEDKFAWKALRLLSMKSPHFFTVNATPSKNLQEYLESMVQKMVKEKPLNQESVMMVESETTGAEDSIEDGNDEYLPTSEEDTKDEDKPTKNENALSKTQIEALAAIPKIQEEWKTMALSLDFQDNEMEYFADTLTDMKSPVELVSYILTLWAENDSNGGDLNDFKAALQKANLLTVALPALQTNDE